MNVPFFSFSNAPRKLKSQWKKSLNNVVNRGIFIQGPEVKNFELAWAEKLKVKYSIGVSNGQDGLILALRALGIGEGDYVAVPAHTFIAVHNAVLSVGAHPYSIDVDVNGLINIELLKNSEQKFKAIIVVHMHGQMVDMCEVSFWAKKLKIFVIEDCSQAHLAVQNQIYAGAWGDVGVFSLYPTKNLGAFGDAGIIVTNDRELAISIRQLSNYGSSPENKYKHNTFGLNHRLDEIQASVLNLNIKYLSSWNLRRKEIADFYLRNLNFELIKPLNSNLDNSVWHHFCVLIKTRDIFKQQLSEFGITTDIHYPYLAAKEVEGFTNSTKTSYPVAENIASKTLSLPLSPWHSDREIRFVVDKINSLFRNS